FRVPEQAETQCDPATYPPEAQAVINTFCEKITGSEDNAAAEPAGDDEEVHHEKDYEISPALLQSTLTGEGQAVGRSDVQRVAEALHGKATTRALQMAIAAEALGGEATRRRQTKDVPLLRPRHGPAPAPQAEVQQRARGPIAQRYLRGQWVARPTDSSTPRETSPQAPAPAPAAEPGPTPASAPRPPSPPASPRPAPGPSSSPPGSPGPPAPPAPPGPAMPAAAGPPAGHPAGPAPAPSADGASSPAGPSLAAGMAGAGHGDGAGSPPPEDSSARGPAPPARAAIASKRPAPGLLPVAPPLSAGVPSRGRGRGSPTKRPRLPGALPRVLDFGATPSGSGPAPQPTPPRVPDPPPRGKGKADATAAGTTASQQPEPGSQPAAAGVQGGVSPVTPLLTPPVEEAGPGQPPDSRAGPAEATRSGLPGPETQATRTPPHSRVLHGPQSQPTPPPPGSTAAAGPAPRAPASPSTSPRRAGSAGGPRGAPAGAVSPRVVEPAPPVADTVPAPGQPEAQPEEVAAVPLPGAPDPAWVGVLGLGVTLLPWQHGPLAPMTIVSTPVPEGGAPFRTGLDADYAHPIEYGDGYWGEEAECVPPSPGREAGPALWDPAGLPIPSSREMDLAMAYNLGHPNPYPFTGRAPRSRAQGAPLRPRSPSPPAELPLPFVPGLEPGCYAGSRTLVRAASPPEAVRAAGLVNDVDYESLGYERMDSVEVSGDGNCFLYALSAHLHAQDFHSLAHGKDPTREGLRAPEYLEMMNTRQAQLRRQVMVCDHIRAACQGDGERGSEFLSVFRHSGMWDHLQPQQARECIGPVGDPAGRTLEDYLWLMGSPSLGVWTPSEFVAEAAKCFRVGSRGSVSGAGGVRAACLGEGASTAAPVRVGVSSLPRAVNPLAPTSRPVDILCFVRNLGRPAGRAPVRLDTYLSGAPPGTRVRQVFVEFLHYDGASGHYNALWPRGVPYGPTRFWHRATGPAPSAPVVLLSVSSAASRSSRATESLGACPGPATASRACATGLCVRAPACLHALVGGGARRGGGETGAALRGHENYANDLTKDQAVGEAHAILGQYLELDTDAADVYGALWIGADLQLGVTRKDDLGQWLFCRADVERLDLRGMPAARFLEPRYMQRAGLALLLPDGLARSQFRGCRANLYNWGGSKVLGVGVEGQTPASEVWAATSPVARRRTPMPEGVCDFLVGRHRRKVLRHGREWAALASSYRGDSVQFIIYNGMPAHVKKTQPIINGSAVHEAISTLVAYGANAHCVVPGTMHKRGEVVVNKLFTALGLMSREGNPLRVELGIPLRAQSGTGGVPPQLTLRQCAANALVAVNERIRALDCTKLRCVPWADMLQIWWAYAKQWKAAHDMLVERPRPFPMPHGVAEHFYRGMGAMTVVLNANLERWHATNWRTIAERTGQLGAPCLDAFRVKVLLGHEAVRGLTPLKNLRRQMHLVVRRVQRSKGSARVLLASVAELLVQAFPVDEMWPLQAHELSRCLAPILKLYAYEALTNTREHTIVHMDLLTFRGHDPDVLPEAHPYDGHEPLDWKVPRLRQLVYLQAGGVEGRGRGELASAARPGGAWVGYLRGDSAWDMLADPVAGDAMRGKARHAIAEQSAARQHSPGSGPRCFWQRGPEPGRLNAVEVGGVLYEMSLKAMSQYREQPGRNEPGVAHMLLAQLAAGLLRVQHAEVARRRQGTAGRRRPLNAKALFAGAFAAAMRARRSVWFPISRYAPSQRTLPRVAVYVFREGPQETRPQGPLGFRGLPFYLERCCDLGGCCLLRQRSERYLALSAVRLRLNDWMHADLRARLPRLPFDDWSDGGVSSGPESDWDSITTDSDQDG
ncbi:hypothetical protein APUTEX25_003748, partial [Auxenochlorella protothecoides]